MTPDEKKILDENTAAETIDDKELEDAAGGMGFVRPDKAAANDEPVGFLSPHTLRFRN